MGKVGTEATLREGVNLLYVLARGQIDHYDDPKQIQEIIARGLGPEIFPTGSMIFIPWTDKSLQTPVTYDYPFVVEDYRSVVDANGVTHDNAMILRAYYATPQTLQFDAPEIVEETESTFQTGYYYYIKSGDDYVEQTVTAGDTIPAGTTYYRHNQSGAQGKIKNGSNRYSQSAYRQWLNSAANANAWWTAQHDCDVAPQQAATLPGFMSGFTQEWLDVFQTVQIKAKANTVTDGGVTDVMYDKFFLPSLSEMYGSQTSASIEGAYWQYEKDATGYESATNGSSSNTCDARKIPTISDPTGSPVYVRLRSAYLSYTYYVYIVYSSGYLSTSGAYSAYRATPACVIF